MADGTPPLVYIDLFQSYKGIRVLLGQRPQLWRWRALNGKNFRVLAESSESYTNFSDALSAIQELFGGRSDVYLRQSETGDQVLRLATSQAD